MTIAAYTPILAAFSDVHEEHNRHVAAGMFVQTFWTLGEFRCVLVRDDGRLSVQIFINDRPFLTEPSKDQAEATGQAEALFAVFSGAHTA